MFGSAISNALNALKFYGGRVEAAARTIAKAGLPVTPAAPAAGPAGAPPDAAAAAAQDPSGDADLAQAMTSMMIAQRAFSAQLRMIETASEMSREVMNLPGETPPR